MAANILKFIAGGLAMIAIGTSLLYLTRRISDISSGPGPQDRYETAGQ